MSSNDTIAYTAPYAAVTGTDRGGAILVVDTTGLTIAVFSVCVRVYLARRDRDRGIGIVLFKDDILCFVSLLFCFVEFALVWVGVVKGNGKDIDLLSDSDLLTVQKLQYASNIFFVIIMYTSRASTVLLYQRLQSASESRIWSVALACLTLWGISCIFILALKCDVSQPWVEYNSQCSGLLARWDYIEISGIAIETALFGLGGYLAYLVQMSWGSKFTILMLFFTRALVVTFAGLRLGRLRDYYDSSNPTYDGVPAVLFGLAEVYCSVITATTPLVKGFIVRFQVVGATAAPGVSKPPYNTSTTNEKLRRKPKEKGKKRVEGDTFDEYEQWMPNEKPRRYNSHCGDTEVTAKTDKTDDDRSDRTLHRDRERQPEREIDGDVIGLAAEY